jgi:hypothetical protein
MFVNDFRERQGRLAAARESVRRNPTSGLAQKRRGSVWAGRRSVNATTLPQRGSAAPEVYSDNASGGRCREATGLAVRGLTIPPPASAPA